jgi:hypothetical protein
MNLKYSQEVQTDAIKVAKSIKKPKQTKEQTKLIAQGIEKGIAEYKKQQSKKSRERDKVKKSLSRKKTTQEQEHETLIENVPPQKVHKLPWSLLVISWVGFIFYIKI